MKDYLVIDLETQNEFADVGGRAYPHLLKISVAGVFSYKKNQLFALEENQIDKLEEMIKDAALVIGFNTKYFDYQVLQPYMKEIDLKKIPSCDIMEDIANVLGHRLSLDSIAKATLNTKKSGFGLDAIRYFREGKMDELKNYCLDDVRITRDIFDYGRKNKELFYFEKGSETKLSVPVYWDEYDADFDRKEEYQIIEESFDDTESVETQKAEIEFETISDAKNQTLF